MRGREGGERRGRQGNRGLNLDTNLNRYCPSQHAGLMRQQAANCCCAQTWGHHMRILSLPFFLPFIFSSTLSLFFSSPAPFCLYFSPWLAVAPLLSLPGSLPCPLFPLQVCRVSSLLFICEEDLFSSTCSFPSLFLHTFM